MVTGVFPASACHGLTENEPPEVQYGGEGRCRRLGRLYKEAMDSGGGPKQGDVESCHSWNGGDIEKNKRWVYVCMGVCVCVGSVYSP